ncbi:Similar to ATP6AP2: ATPase H()-transporting accessory protein 2 (Drosophila melanogaster) [Cotesia congregata]|uniref:Similar to ATP6AP2: ATPase H( )-transporting accessory protein 2 (Drosophila melanogaster) n=1 Tax=Cotesia congregata TaxID=51543 RepID=A0A8J2H9N9_COTCN|nr:Similar to ATP6AP2: ATPase H()-transporting accessory protein 2 (Drosophila melanogaster) [Cotesia congregata]
MLKITLLTLCTLASVVSIAVEGVDSLDSQRGQRFPLIVDEVEETTWQAVSRRLGGRENNNTLVRICVGDGVNALGQSALGELKPIALDESSVKFLDPKIEEDRKFIEEIQLLRAIAQHVPSTVTANSKPDIYWLVVSGLQPLIELHGKNSQTVQEAFNLLNRVLDDISNAFIEVYNGDVVIAAFTNDANKVRNTRSVESLRVRRAEPVSTESSASSEKPQDSTATSFTSTPNEETMEDKLNSEETESNKGVSENTNQPISTTELNTNTNEHTDSSDELNYQHEVQSMTGQVDKPVELKDVNLAKKYSANYPVIFNIFLWFSIIFVFSLIAICIAIADMDPGRDSIIYRMTSNRMKKDN